MTVQNNGPNKSKSHFTSQPISLLCCTGLQTVTAEREDAIMRADKAEHKSRKLRQQLVELQKKLDDYSSVSSHSPVESVSSHLHAESAPARAPESPPSQPPVSSQNGDSDLSAQIEELTRQLEAAAVSASARDADLKTAHAELASERGRFESAKAALRTELAVLSQEAEADKAVLTQRVQELSSQHEAHMQQEDALRAALASDRDSFAERGQQLESELARLTQQLEGQDEEVRRLKAAQQQLHETVEASEQEAQENFDKFSAKEEVCTYVHPTCPSHTLRMSSDDRQDEASVLLL